MKFAWWWPHVQISSYQSSRHLDMSFFISDISIWVGLTKDFVSDDTGLYSPLWYNHHHLLFFKWDFDLDDCIALWRTPLKEQISNHAMLHEGKNTPNENPNCRIEIPLLLNKSHFNPLKNCIFNYFSQF